MSEWCILSVTLPTSANSMAEHREKIHELQGSPSTTFTALVTSSKNTPHVHSMPLPLLQPNTCHTNLDDNSHCCHSRSKGRVPSVRPVRKEQSPRTILFVSVRFKLFFFCLTPNTAIYSFFFKLYSKLGYANRTPALVAGLKILFGTPLSQHRGMEGCMVKTWSVGVLSTVAVMPPHLGSLPSYLKVGSRAKPGMHRPYC